MKKICFSSILLLILFIACSEIPESVKLSPDKIKLGRLLFFDKRLSQDNTVACASCHQPQFGFADNKAFSIGTRNQKTSRNSATLNNLENQSSFFHDGRAKTLVQQAMEVMNNPIEMGDSRFIPAKLKMDSNYVTQFQNVYNAEINLFLVADALTEFERSLNFNSSPFDRFLAGDSIALSEDQKKGFNLFNGKGRCRTCHSGTNLTDNQFHNIGFFSLADSLSDIGRFKVTNDSSDLGKFRTPSLRNISLSAPYFHDGQIATLREVINRYNKPNPMGDGDFKDAKLLPIHLKELEKYQLQQFLNSLTDDSKLSEFTDIEIVDSVQQLQTYSKNEYEEFELLPAFERKQAYFRIFYPNLVSKSELNDLDDLKNEVDRKQKKIEIERDKFRKEFQDLFKNGDYLLFNQQIEIENKIFNQLNIQMPKATSIENLKIRLQQIASVNQSNPNTFNWSSAIFDYRDKLSKDTKL